MPEVEKEGIQNWERSSYYSGYRSRGSANLPFSSGIESLLDSGQMYSDYHAGPPYHTGSAWWLSKTDFVVHPIQNAVRNDSQGRVLFQGNVYGIVQGTSTPNNSAYADADLIAKGTTAIARVEPSRSNLDIAVTAAELRREGISIPFRAVRWKELSSEIRKIHRHGSDLFLSYQFGWKPLIDEIKTFCKSVDKFDRTWRQYKKDQDTLIKRRYVYQGQPDTILLREDRAIPRPTSFNTFGTGWSTVTRKDEAWFEGAFRYYLPMSKTQMEDMSKYATYARKILGVKLDPEVLYNLSPWSWAADWFTNTGDVVHNISAMGRDGLTMQYGFMMGSSIFSEEHTCNFSWNNFGVDSKVPPGSGTSYYRRRRVYKKRIVASPYGFGLSDGDLSVRQKAIIAALGLSAGGSKVR